MKIALANASRTCPAWCSIHDTDGDVCLGAAASLDFRSPDRGPGLIAWAEAALGYSPDEGTDMSVTFPGGGTAYMTVADAEKVANMLLGLVAAARSAESATIPGPRSGTEDGTR